MTVLFRTLDVDYVQWKAVTRTLLRLDFRLPLASDGSAGGKVGSLLSMVLVTSLFGAGVALVVSAGGGVLLTAVITLSYLSVMLATTLLTQHGTTMLSTSDYIILGSRPVSSRTFLAIRLTNVLVHALLVTSLTAYPVVLTYFMARGVHIGRGLGAVVAIYAWAVALTLALVAAYATVLRSIGAARLRSAVGYLQLLGGFLAYGGLLLGTRLLRDSRFAGLELPDEWWVAALPPAWFASYIELATGTTNSTTHLRLGLSVAALLALVVALRGKLGVDYARGLSELTTAGDPGPVTTQRRNGWLLFARDEGRAAALLVIAHFRHDLRVRMGILAIVPLIVFYLLLGRQEQTFDLVAMAVLLFPALVTRHFSTSDTHHASWIFHATPARHPALIVGVKNIATVYFLIPFLVLVTAVFAWRSGDVSHALVHAGMLGLLSHIALQGAIVIKPRLPFSEPPDKTSGSGSLMTWMLVVIVGGQLTLLGLDRFVYASSGRTLATFGALLVLSAALNRLIAWRVGHE